MIDLGTLGGTTSTATAVSGNTVAGSADTSSGQTHAVAWSLTPASATPTVTALRASPNPATTGQTVTLTASVSGSDGSTLDGSVQFETGGTDIGTPVAVSSGTAAITTTFPLAGPFALSATFTPASSSYAPSTSTYYEMVTTPTTPTSGSVPLAATVPAVGSFTFTVAPGTVNLTVSGSTADGALNPVTVSDTRNTYPGGSVYGQASVFAGSGTAAGSTISGGQLGWTPTATTLGTGVLLGGTVVPGSPGGLGTTPAVLAFATASNGYGVSSLGANLTLDIPATVAAGPYTGALTVTAVTSLA
jgi:hypothetical protein